MLHLHMIFLCTAGLVCSWQRQDGKLQQGWMAKSCQKNNFLALTEEHVYSDSVIAHLRLLQFGFEGVPGNDALLPDRIDPPLCHPESLGRCCGGYLICSNI